MLGGASSSSFRALYLLVGEGRPVGRGSSSPAAQSARGGGGIGLGDEGRGTGGGARGPSAGLGPPRGQGAVVKVGAPVAGELGVARWRSSSEEARGVGGLRAVERGPAGRGRLTGPARAARPPGSLGEGSPGPRRGSRGSRRWGGRGSRAPGSRAAATSGRRRRTRAPRAEERLGRAAGLYECPTKPRRTWCLGADPPLVAPSRPRALPALAARAAHVLQRRRPDSCLLSPEPVRNPLAAITEPHRPCPQSARASEEVCRATGRVAGASRGRCAARSRSEEDGAARGAESKIPEEGRG